jgi:hypothetical protein
MEFQDYGSGALAVDGFHVYENILENERGGIDSVGVQGHFSFAADLSHLDGVLVYPQENSTDPNVNDIGECRLMLSAK